MSYICVLGIYLVDIWGLCLLMMADRGTCTMSRDEPPVSRNDTAKKRVNRHRGHRGEGAWLNLNACRCEGWYGYMP